MPPLLPLAGQRALAGLGNDNRKARETHERESNDSRWCSFQPESWELSSPPAPAPPPPPRGLRSRVLPCPGLVCSPPQAGLHPLAGSCARTQIISAGPHPLQLPGPEP